MTLIRHPQLECEGPDCRVRVPVPTECADQEAFLPPGWVRVVYGFDSEGLPVTDDKDYHTEACLFAALARAHGTGAVALELDLLRKEQRQISPELYEELHPQIEQERVVEVMPQIGAEAQRKMDERSKSAGINHMFHGDPDDPLVCKICGTDHMGG